jgi:hypothetical protein
VVIIQGVDTTQNTRITNVETRTTAAYAKANTNISSDLTFTVTSSGMSDWLIDGVSDPTLTLYRGVTYYFNINASGHPFYIQTVSGAYSSVNVYTSGVTGGGTQVGTLTFTVPLDAPNDLYYVCQNHSTMAGAFVIRNLISTINTQNTNITTSTNLAQSAYNNSNTRFSSSAVAIGNGAGATSQGSTTVAIGAFAGQTTQGTSAVAIGFNAGQTTQGTSAVAIGMTSGYTLQSNGAVAIGDSAGYINQGVNAIAIGKFAGLTNQGNNSIILNATGVSLDQTANNTFTVKPVRNAGSGGLPVGFFQVAYNPTTGEFVYYN